MTYEEIIKYTMSLTDEELLVRAEIAYADTLASEPNSDWNANCFAGLVVFSDEMNRRGLKRTILEANAKRTHR